MIKVGTGTLTLSGINTYGGGTTVNAGTLLLSGAGTLGHTDNATVVSGGTLDLGSTTQTQAVLNQSGGIVQNGTIKPVPNGGSNPNNAIDGNLGTAWNAGIAPGSGTQVIWQWSLPNAGQKISGTLAEGSKQ